MQDEGWASVWADAQGVGGTLPEPACCSTDVLSVRGVKPHWLGAWDCGNPRWAAPLFMPSMITVLHPTFLPKFPQQASLWP